MALPVPQAVGAKAEGSTAATANWPAHQAGDVGVLVAETRFLSDLSDPSADGWAAVENSPQAFEGGGTVSTTLKMFVKRATSSSEAGPSLTSTNHLVAQILTFRGCIATGTPYETGAGGGDATGTASTSVVIPGGETTIDDCLIVAAVAMGQDTADAQFSGWANDDLANVAEMADTFTDIGNGGGFGVATGEKATAGAYGATSATSATSFAQARISLALMPEEETGGTEHFGAVSLELTDSVAVTAKKDAKAASVTSLTAGVVVAAKKDAHGASAVPLTANVAAAATKNAHGASTTPLTFDAATSAKKNAHGSTVVPIVFTVATAGDTGAAPVTGAASVELTFGAAVTGRKDAHAAAALPVSFSTDTAAVRTVHGSAALPITVGTATSATAARYGAVDLPLTFTIGTQGATASDLVVKFFGSPSPNRGVGRASPTAALVMGAGGPQGVGQGSPGGDLFGPSEPGQGTP